MGKNEGWAIQYSHLSYTERKNSQTDLHFVFKNVRFLRQTDQMLVSLTNYFFQCVVIFPAGMGGEGEYCLTAATRYMYSRLSLSRLRLSRRKNLVLVITEI